jgi:F-type H+-transporting ATPase subunit b
MPVYATLVVAAAETSVKAPNPILPAKNEIIWGFLSFVVLFAVMAKFAFPAVQKSMQDRTDRIRENLDEAERVKTEAQTILDEYQRQLTDAKNESNRIIEEARQTAEQLRRDLMQRAETEVAELRQRSQEDILSAQQRAMADLRAQVSNLAIELAEKVVERNLDRDTNLALIDSYITQVGSAS